MDGNAHRANGYPYATALTIGGSDPSGGAGVQADLKTFQQLGVYGMSVITLLTVQNTQAVQRVELMSPDLVEEQWAAVVGDIMPNAIKIGALGSAELTRLTARLLRSVTCPIIVDPVIVSKHGNALAGPDVIEAYRQDLLPLATIVTPNRFEIERLTGVSSSPITSPNSMAWNLEPVMAEFQQMGVRRLLMKLGRDSGAMVHCLTDTEESIEIRSPVLDTGQSHGTGCVLSAALTAAMAIHPDRQDWEQLAVEAIAHTLDAIHYPSQFGQGIHPADVRGMAYPGTWNVQRSRLASGKAIRFSP